jgi:hypothetical protein
MHQVTATPSASTPKPILRATNKTLYATQRAAPTCECLCGCVGAGEDAAKQREAEQHGNGVASLPVNPSCQRAMRRGLQQQHLYNATGQTGTNRHVAVKVRQEHLVLAHQLLVGGDQGLHLNPPRRQSLCGITCQQHQHTVILIALSQRTQMHRHGSDARTCCCRPDTSSSVMSVYTVWDQSGRAVFGAMSFDKDKM